MVVMVLGSRVAVSCVFGGQSGVLSSLHRRTCSLRVAWMRAIWFAVGKAGRVRA